MRFGRTDDFQAGSLVWVNSEELKELFPAKLVNDPPAELYEDTTLVVEVLQTLKCGCLSAGDLTEVKLSEIWVTED